MLEIPSSHVSEYASSFKYEGHFTPQNINLPRLLYFKCLGKNRGRNVIFNSFFLFTYQIYKSRLEKWFSGINLSLGIHWSSPFPQKVPQTFAQRLGCCTHDLIYDKCLFIKTHKIIDFEKTFQKFFKIGGMVDDGVARLGGNAMQVCPIYSSPPWSNPQSFH